MKFPVLYLFCGKMGAGKSTESKILAGNENAVLISEDDWLSILYPDEIKTFEDYIQYSAKLRPLVFDHVLNILKTGTNVAMDFPANTPKQRTWFTELANAAGAKAQLIYLKASDELCLQRIAARQLEQPQRAAFDTESVFLKVTQFFQAPDEREGLDVQIIIMDA